MRIRSFMGRSVIGAALVSSVLGVASLPTGAAAFPVPKVKVPKVPKLPSGVTDNDRKQLSEVNRLAQEGARVVPGNFVGDFQKKAEAMAKAKAIFDDGKARLDTVVDKSIDEGAIRRWSEFELAYTQGLPQLDITAKYQPITDLHAQRIPVIDADLDNLDAAVAAFGKKVHKDNKRVLENWQKLAKEARATNTKLLETEKARASSEAASLDLKQRNGILDRADAVLAGMAQAAKDDKPIDAAAWTELEAALKEADAYSPKIRTSYMHRAWTYRIYEAWFASDAPTAVAGAMFGTVAASGTITSKAGKVSFKAQKGKCYAFLGRFAQRTGNENVGDIDRIWGKDFAETIAFTHWAGGGERSWERFDGACPTKDMTLNWNLTLETPGSKVDYRWVAVEWSRDAFPVQIAARANAFGATNCSAAQTLMAWQNHVPGLLVWKEDGEPLLITDKGNNGFRGDSHNEKETGVTFSEASLAWPEKRTLPEPKYYQQCATYEDSIDPIVDKFAKCHRSLDKTFGAKWTAAQKRRDTALTPGAYNAAVRELESIEVAAGKAREAQCGPQENKIEKAMSDAILKLNDWFLSGQTEPNQPDVPAYMRDVAEGAKRFK